MTFEKFCEVNHLSRRQRREAARCLNTFRLRNIIMLFLAKYG